jgi:hypothetical protein
MTIVDKVEGVFLELYDQEQFRSLLEAVYDEDAVHGSMALDNKAAAKMIQNQAKKVGYADVAGLHLDVIAGAIHMVLERYGLSRRERRSQTCCSN